MKRYIFLAGILFALIIIFINGAKPTSLLQQQANKGLYTVIRVVDGDTVHVEINGKDETIRLIGVDTPETVDPRKSVQCFGKEASNKAKELLTGAKVSLEADPSQGNRDKYNRLLRYIFTEKGQNFNKLMIAQGYAHEYTYNLPYKYQDEFKQAQRDARENKKGLWADDACITTVVPTQIPTGIGCDCAKPCGQLSCEEAQYQLNSCGCRARDGDGNGIACDASCQ